MSQPQFGQPALNWYIIRLMRENSQKRDPMVRRVLAKARASLRQIEMLEFFQAVERLGAEATRE